VGVTVSSTTGEEVKIINAGVSGDTSAGGVRRIDWTLQDDVDGLIVALGANDLLRGLSAAETRKNIDTILSKAGAKDIPILLVGLDVPGNFGGEYEIAFEAIYPDLAKKHDTLLFTNFLGPLIETENLVVAFLKYMQPDGLHPNADGVTKIVNGIGPSVRDLAALVRGSPSGSLRSSDRPLPRPAAP